MVLKPTQIQNWILSKMDVLYQNGLESEEEFAKSVETQWQDKDFNVHFLRKTQFLSIQMMLWFDVMEVRSRHFRKKYR